MQISKIENNLSFEARIKINKPKIESKLLKSTGISLVSGGSSSIMTGASSGADMIVHNSNSAIPFAQHSSSLFDKFFEYGHKILNLFVNKGYQHNGYDASFFSGTMSSTGTGTYSQGMNTLIKGIEKDYKSKIPT